ncbi:hypothetical protein [Parasphingopyxis marina]|uniref:Spore coat protein U domain-containing protein n=1 Tax=Parasphingopyxis marina TaxID=2761622 RepID=A0A842I1V6_9SPHN|nr:hypothetical protein [Parasphingopyxis marina]MBC2778761.1 hypothetical protein [Parasphingopyxis marina]
MRPFTLLAAGALLASTPALANDCSPEFVNSTETVNVASIEIGVGSFARENFNIRVRNDGNGQCSATIRFTRLGGSAAPGSPSYTLRSGPTTLEILGEGSTPTIDSDLLIPNAPGGTQGRAVPFQLTLPSEWGMRSGLYSEQIELALLDPSGTEVDTMLLTINVRIPQAVAIRVVGATGTNDLTRINLGNLSSTAATRSDPFGVRVWSTSGYLVSFASENNGQLAHEGNLDQIDYELYFDGQNVNLAGGDSFLFADFTPSLGRVHPLRARVGPVTARAGHYEDRVTITVTAV